MPHKVLSHVSAVNADMLRNGLTGNCVRSKYRGSVSQRQVLKHLREQIRCIEGRSPVFDHGIGPHPGSMPTPAAVHALGGGGGRSIDDARHQKCCVPGALLCQPQVEQSALDRVGVDRRQLFDEDGGALPRITQPPALPSSSFSNRTEPPASASSPGWTLGIGGNSVRSHLDPADISALALDVSGVHEIKPAFDPFGDLAGNPTGNPVGAPDWAASWSAARSFMLALMARRMAQGGARRPILWCLPRKMKFEHGTPYGQGLQHFGLAPGDVLFAETGSNQDTLWALEEGLKSKSLALVAGLIDDVMLTPARRLALAAQKYKTPCLLLTHPRMPPVGATASRWRVAAHPSAPHALSARLNLPGARRIALMLERYRAEPLAVTGREVVVEWCDETVCLHLVAELCDRSDATRRAKFSAVR